jgi:hypothetical protein
MLSNNKRFNFGHRGKSDLYNSTHKDEHGGRYDEYLDYDTGLEGHPNNSKNLFDDSNSKDRKWIKLAKVYLARGR